MTVIRLRRGTDSQWTSVNPILAQGEPGYDLDTHIFKIGDGITHWNDLPTPPQVPLGAIPKVQQTPPGAATENGYPVLWIAGQSTLTAVGATPTAPAFDLVNFTVTAPSVTGVEYQIVDGANRVPLVGGVATSVAGFARPYVLTVEAVALPGYVLTAAYSWQRQLIDVGNLTVYASDGFAGTASTPLGLTNSAAGRTLDNTQGGSGSLQWYSGHATLAGGLMIAANGTSASKNTDAAQDGAHGESSVNTGANNHGVELNVIAPFTPAHSRNFAFYVGGTNNARANAQTVQMYISSTTATIRFDGNPTGELTYRTNVTEAMILGTWRCTWVNKFMQVTAPDGQVFGKDYTNDGLTHGAWVSVGVGDYGGTKQWSTFDWAKIYR